MRPDSIDDGECFGSRDKDELSAGLCDQTQLTTRSLWGLPMIFRDFFDDLRNALNEKGLRDNPIDLGRLLFIRTNCFSPPGEDSQRYFAGALTNRPRQVPTAHSRHADVGENRIERLRVE